MVRGLCTDGAAGASERANGTLRVTVAGDREGFAERHVRRSLKAASGLEDSPTDMNMCTDQAQAQLVIDSCRHSSFMHIPWKLPTGSFGPRGN